MCYLLVQLNTVLCCVTIYIIVVLLLIDQYSYISLLIGHCCLRVDVSLNTIQTKNCH